MIMTKVALLKYKNRNLYGITKKYHLSNLVLSLLSITLFEVHLREKNMSLQDLGLIENLLIFLLFFIVVIIPGLLRKSAKNQKSLNRYNI